MVYSFSELSQLKHSAFPCNMYLTNDVFVQEREGMFGKSVDVLLYAALFATSPQKNPF